MRRMIFTEEEYAEIVRFAEERGLNAKEAVLAFVRFGNKAADLKQKAGIADGNSSTGNWQNNNN